MPEQPISWGKVFPGDAGLEDEQDAGQDRAIVYGLAARVSPATTPGFGQKRLDDLP
jgi:hypothetical protein